MEWGKQKIKHGRLNAHQVICLLSRHGFEADALRFFRSWKTSECLILNLKIGRRSVFLLVRKTNARNVTLISVADLREEEVALARLMPSDTTIEQTSNREFCEMICCWIQFAPDRTDQSFWRELLRILSLCSMTNVPVYQPA